MPHLNALLSAARDALRDHEAAVLATVVRVQGSAYRRPGARMLLTAYGKTLGSISGGCLEGDLIQKAWWYLEGGYPVVRRYTTFFDEEGEGSPFGLGCNGTIDILLEPLNLVRDSGVLLLLEQVRQGRLSGAIATVYETPEGCAVRVGSHLLIDPQGQSHGDLGRSDLTSAVLSDLLKAQASGHHQWQSYVVPEGVIQVFLEVVPAQQHLVICGAGADAGPLVIQAKALGWHVSVFDGRSHYARRERFPLADQVAVVDIQQPFSLQEATRDAVVAVMTHSISQDLFWLGAFLQHPPRYLGQLGPRQRTERLLQDLGLSPASLEGTLHYPIGLDLGGDGPEAVALAIISEMLAVLHGRSGGMLNLRDVSIHDVND